MKIRVKLAPERCPACDCIAHPDPCSSTGCDCHLALTGRIERGKYAVGALARVARLSALGVAWGMWPKEAVAHALEAENLKNYAAALGYTPGDVADFLELGLTIEQVKNRMARGKRPETDLRALLNASEDQPLVCIRPEDGLCFHLEVDHGISMDPANPRATIFWTKCLTCGVVESSPDRSPVLVIPRKIER